MRYQRSDQIIAELKATYPNARCSLDFSNPLQLLVATILSAQSTDKRVNQVTPALFDKYLSAKDFAQSSLTDLEKMIHSTGFFRNKAKHIREACLKITTKHGGKVPNRMDQLLDLQGVARKTANVVLGVAFGISEGVVVDTHVARISRRLGFSNHSTPEKIEHDLMKIVPREQWIHFSHLMIFHGRSTCKAKRPECEKCSLEHLCESEDKYS